MNDTSAGNKTLTDFENDLKKLNDTSKMERDICVCKPGKPTIAEQEEIRIKKEKYREEVQRIRTEVEMKKKMAEEISSKIQQIIKT